MIGKIALFIAPIITFIIPFLVKRVFFRKKQKLLKLVENDKKLKKFIYFLLTTELYKDFIHQLHKKHKIKEIDIWIKTTSESYLISEAFKWNDTLQGYDFWYGINLLWNKQYKYKDIEFLLVKNLIEKRL